jgi:hypothetical protein
VTLYRRELDVDADEILHRYTLRPRAEDLQQVRELLATRLDDDDEDTDTDVLKLCCVQLFNVGDLDDVVTIWQAKSASFDAFCSIDVQLLCGAGLVETKAYLAAMSSQDAADALQYIEECEATGDFAGFSVSEWAAMYATYYEVTP